MAHQCLALWITGGLGFKTDAKVLAVAGCRLRGLLVRCVVYLFNRSQSRWFWWVSGWLSERFFLKKIHAILVATVPACDLFLFFIFLRFMTGCVMCGLWTCGGYNSSRISVLFPAGCTRFLLVQVLTKNCLHVRFVSLGMWEHLCAV